MKKISFNKKIMKKVVLLVICALLVGLLTYSIVDSYVDKRHTTTNSDNSTTVKLSISSNIFSIFSIIKILSLY